MRLVKLAEIMQNNEIKAFYIGKSADNAMILSSILFDHSLRRESRIPRLLPQNEDSKTVLTSAMQDIANRADLNGISLVIFSYGSGNTFLAELLTNVHGIITCQPGGSQNFDRLKQRMAVFCLGGENRTYESIQQIQVSRHFMFRKSVGTNDQRHLTVLDDIGDTKGSTAFFSSSSSSTCEEDKYTRSMGLKDIILRDLHLD